MKIIEVISSLGNGGAEKFVVELSNELANTNEVILCSFRPVAPWMIFPEQLKKNVSLLTLDKKSGFDPSLYLKLFRLFKREKPGAIHFHLDACIPYLVPLIIFFPDVKFIHTIHSSYNTDKITVFKKLNRIRFLSSKLTYVCISRPIYEDFTKNFPAFSYKLIPNGIKRMSASTGLDSVREEINAYKKNTKTRVFSIIGNYSAPKNFSMITEVFSRLYKEKHNVILLMIGSDSSEQQTEWKKIETLKSENTFMLGAKNNVQDYLICSDAYCLCSLFEGLPISVLEAYSMGKAVLSTPAGGVPGVLKQGVNGLLSDGFSSPSYYNMLLDFLNMPSDQLEKIERQNQADFAAYYTIEKTSDMYSQILKNKS